MSEEKQNEKHTEQSALPSGAHPSTEGRSAADVWREESKIVPVE